MLLALGGLTCGAVATLLDWARIVDVGLVIPFPKPALVVVLLSVIAMAVVNSFAEELLWRDVLLSLTGGAFWRFEIVLFQAVSFGLAHWSGVPSGVAGVVASGFFSVLLVAIRIRWGFASAVVVHFTADLLIFSTIAQFANYGGSGFFLA